MHSHQQSLCRHVVGYHRWDNGRRSNQNSVGVVFMTSLSSFQDPTRKDTTVIFFGVCSSVVVFPQLLLVGSKQ